MCIRDRVNVALGTDSGICAHGRNLQELSLLVDHGLSPEHAVLAGTRDAAVLLGLSDRIGTLERGKRADVVVCSGDPLSDVTALGDPARVTAVVKDGAVYKGSALA